MSKFNYYGLLVFSTLFVVPYAHASHGGDSGNPLEFLFRLFHHLFQGGGGGTGNSVPELDGSMAPIAVALLVGVAGIAIEVKRRKKQP